MCATRTTELNAHNNNRRDRSDQLSKRQVAKEAYEACAQGVIVANLDQNVTDVSEMAPKTRSAFLKKLRGDGAFESCKAGARKELEELGLDDADENEEEEEFVFAFLYIYCM